MTTNATHNTEAPVLLVNGTGKIGRRVAERLEARGIPARVGSRGSRPPFDWERPSTWAPAVGGAKAAFISYYPDVAAPGAADSIGTFSELAVEAGVRRLVLLSGRGEEEALRGEEAVKRSGVDWTVVRSGFFMQNFSESVFLEPLLEGELAFPADRVREPFVDADDIADVAAAALTDDRHAGEVYEVTGPDLLRFDEAVAEIARASGRDIRYTLLTVEEFSAVMAAAGEPPEMVSLLTYLFTEVLDGRNEYLADGVRRALGREPRSFRDYAERTAAVWQGTRAAA